ncbi:hypothetical protein FHX48_001852 [Microbacterium halimionae]|uniref:CAAX prenyl protease 2/Lysostaphin resistance protein A-like domain-containing protein n=1 Tax=Microbacterium halimionae TaxID=1526413 RepID=A0A7W3JPR5_9MICO|nr:CPBP family intramembrane glutamic endopeptidase [Microbacterium halimionae]MBA8816759.1 hypothetical protein [Microbacterium halimionae]NII94945.1 hypothetical protein [Microbacterium halimionae]
MSDTDAPAAEAPLEGTDAAPDPDRELRRARRRSRRGSGRNGWRDGGKSVVGWGWEIVGWVVIALGIGVLVGTAANQFIGGVGGAILGTAAIWVSMFVPIALAFTRSVPRGLLKFRPIDVLYGIVIGGALRLAQGVLEMAAGGNGAFPSYGSLSGSWWITDLVGPVVISPLLEEFFFHAVLLIALYSALRRLMESRILAGIFAVVMASGVFVLAHALTATLSWDAVVALLLVGLVNGTLVVLTGRIWGAVLVHIMFNASFVALALVGTVLGASGGGVVLQ